MPWMFQHHKLHKNHGKLIIALKYSGFKFYLQLAQDFWLNVFVKLVPDIHLQKEHI